MADVHNTMCGQCETLQTSVHPAAGLILKSVHNAVEVFGVQGQALDEVEVLSPIWAWSFSIPRMQFEHSN
jgi:hypothetical protein